MWDIISDHVLSVEEEKNNKLYIFIERGFCIFIKHYKAAHKSKDIKRTQL